MARDDRRIRVIHVLRLAVAATVGAAILAVPSGAVAQTISLRAGFGGGARLGASTSLRVAVTVAVGPLSSPLTEFRLLTPAGIDFATSGLGIASCRRPASEIASVLNASGSQESCPANALMGVGRASADLLVEPLQAGSATLRLYSGAPVRDRPGLIVIADTYNPARYHLTYQGYLYVPPEHFGVGVAIAIPQIPTLPFGAPLALSSVSFVVGGAAIGYSKIVRGRRVRYRPAGVELPARCPAGGFRFRAILRFADASRRQVDDVVPCPPGSTA